ncbi:hypothetical protein [Thalassomonas sp. M1454]|uniref:hypothetical protein n=1 Tax=Thalassomonas sp. M1454 TaxID=2594477 RepID=UPI00117D8947|nr:hypothetical protein [Thalassomonas sp. M1454]TRX57415.1 hypothetical protein FNN08_07935 [Thalassomonas sp. M1454]
MKIIQFATLFTGLIYLSACSSPPPDVTADVPLINQNTPYYNAAETLPEDLWANFNNAYPGIAINTSYGVFQIEKTYTSAMGHWCIAFNLSLPPSGSESSQLFHPQDKYYGPDRRACKSNDSWFIVSPLMGSNSGGMNK